MTEIIKVNQISQRSDRHIVRYQYIYLPLLIGVIFFTLMKINFNLVPDFFGLSETKEPEKIAETIISVISSVLGISLALILLGFEIFRHRLGRIGTNRLLANKHVIFIISIQISLLLYSFVFLILMGKEVDNKELTVLYFLSIIFIFSIISLFFSGKQILSETESKKYVQEECEKIVPQNVAKIIGYNHGMVDFEKELEHIDSSPFIILRDLGEKYAKDNSHHMAAYIIYESTKKFIPFISDKFERRALGEFYKALFIIWNGIVDESVRNNGYQSLKQILNSFLLVHNYHADNKVGLIRTEFLEDYMKDFIGKLLLNNQDDVAINGLMTIESIYKTHLEKSIPDENQLDSLSYIYEENEIPNISHNTELEIQWDFIAEHLPRLLELYANKSIEYKKERVLRFTFISIQELIRITNDSKMGQYQKHFVIIGLYMNLSFLIRKAFDDDVIDAYSAISAFEFTTLNDVISNKPKYTEQLFYFLCDLFMHIIERENTNVHLSFLTRRTTFAPFRKLFQIHEKGDALTETVDKVLNFLTYLKQHFEKDIASNYNNYLSLLEELNSMKDRHLKSMVFTLGNGDYADKEKEKISLDLITKIDKIILSFQKVKVANKNVKKQQGWWDS